MSRTRTLLGFFVIWLAAALAVVSLRRLPAPPVASATAAAPPSASASLAAVVSAEPAPSGAGSGGGPPEGSFARSESGEPLPELPDTAPQRVSLGIALVTYRGAQFAARATRERAAAEALARELIVKARVNFAEAVRLADPGSAADAGSFPRGVLEPAVEVAVFSLQKDEVLSAPLDTPRGFWVVKRLP